MRLIDKFVFKESLLITRVQIFIAKQTCQGNGQSTARGPNLVQSAVFTLIYHYIWTKVNE
jgi:hypothetical protein